MLACTYLLLAKLLHCNCMRVHGGSAGAWFTVVLACIYAFIMGLWFWGMTNKNNFFLRRYFLRFRTLETMLVSLPAKASGGSHADLDIAGTKEPSNQERLVLVDGNKPVCIGGLACCLMGLAL